MIPVLLMGHQYDFSRVNAAAYLPDAISATVYECNDRGDGIQSYLEMTYPINGEAAKDIAVGNTIAVTTHADDENLYCFFVESVEKNLNGTMIVYAQTCVRDMDSIPLVKPRGEAAYTFAKGESLSSMFYRFINEYDKSGRINVRVANGSGISLTESVRPDLSRSFWKNIFGVSSISNAIPEAKWTIKSDGSLYVEALPGDSANNRKIVRSGLNIVSANVAYDLTGMYNVVLPYWARAEEDNNIVMWASYGDQIELFDKDQYKFVNNRVEVVNLTGYIYDKMYGVRKEILDSVASYVSTIKDSGDSFATQKIKVQAWRDQLNALYYTCKDSRSTGSVRTKAEITTEGVYEAGGVENWYVTGLNVDNSTYNNEWTPSKATINEFAQEWVAQQGFEPPERCISITIANSDEINDLNLYDVVHVDVPELDIYGEDTALRVCETLWNVLEDRYESVTLGTKSDNIANAIKSIR